MSEYIKKADLYNEIAKLEELAIKRYLDTPGSSPSSVRYMSQLNEISRIKYLIADFPSVEMDDVKLKTTGNEMIDKLLLLVKENPNLPIVPSNGGTT